MFGELFFEQFRAAQSVFGATFVGTLGRHSVSLELLFGLLKAAHPV